MIQNIDADMNILKCPVCSTPLTLKENQSNVVYCDKAFVFNRSADGGISYIDKKEYHQPKKKYFVKYIVAISVFMLVIVAIIMVAGEDKGKSSEKSDAHEKYINKITTYTFDWPDNDLGKTVPETDFEHGWMYSDYSDRFAVDIGNVSKEEFENYVKECTEAGFDVNSNNSGTYMHAFNHEGYELQVSYDSKDESMSISASAPKVLEEYEWPQVGFATLLPVPKSRYGVIKEEEDRFEAKIYQTSNKDFEAYVDDCIKAGFDNRYEKSVSAGYFKGYDDNGYELYIRYEENDYNQTMTIVLE